MKAINAIFACMLSVSVPTFAESNFNPSINIDLQTRVSYLNDRIDNHIRHDASGFKGDYFLLSVSGQVTDRLTYSWRQRINQKKERSDRFDGTDWVYLDYKLDDHWSVAAGKQVAMVGGYEYDRNPVDIFVSSEFWNNIAPFQFGASATYTTTNGKNRFSAQVTQSLFNTPDNRDMLAYHLHWAGNYGWLNTLYSANMIEYVPGVHCPRQQIHHGQSIVRTRLYEPRFKPSDPLLQGLLRDGTTRLSPDTPPRTVWQTHIRRQPHQLTSRHECAARHRDGCLWWRCGVLPHKRKARCARQFGRISLHGHQQQPIGNIK